MYYDVLWCIMMYDVLYIYICAASSPIYHRSLCVYTNPHLLTRNWLDEHQGSDSLERRLWRGGRGRPNKQPTLHQVGTIPWVYGTIMYYPHGYHCNDSTERTRRWKCRSAPFRPNLGCLSSVRCIKKPRPSATLPCRGGVEVNRWGDEGSNGELDFTRVCTVVDTIVDAPPRNYGWESVGILC